MNENPSMDGRYSVHTPLGHIWVSFPEFGPALCDGPVLAVTFLADTLRVKVRSGGYSLSLENLTPVDLETQFNDPKDMISVAPPAQRMLELALAKD